MKILIGFTAACVLAAGIAWMSPARAEVQGDGFTEFIMSCTGDSYTIMDLTRGRAVMIRVAPECDPMDPLVFKATKKRTLHLTSSRDGDEFHHTIKVWVGR